MQHYIIHHKRSPGWHLLPPRFNDRGPACPSGILSPPPRLKQGTLTTFFLREGSEVASSTFPESRQLVPPPIQRGSSITRGGVDQQWCACERDHRGSWVMEHLHVCLSLGNDESSRNDMCNFQKCWGDKKGGSDLFGMMRRSDRWRWPVMKAQLFCKSDKLALFD